MSASNPYTAWRRESRATLRLSDQEAPPERLLQAVWQHQRLQRRQLRLLDGRPLIVIHPGFWNHEAGPDFRGAVLQFGTEPPRTGDVEIDLAANAWRGHGHADNLAYRNVILHIVWNGAARANLPTLALESFLDAPLTDLVFWHGTESVRQLPLDLAGHCSAPLKQLGEAARSTLLQQAALARLQAKAAWFEARARQSGWEQSLWEGLFRALGYKHNSWPMQRLAELIPRLRESGHGDHALTLPDWQARLLGVSGLLPADPPARGRGASQHHRQLWDIWWRQRDALADCTLPRSAWHLGGLRPANHPQRRLALAAHWLHDATFIARIEKWLGDVTGKLHPENYLLEALQPVADEFWLRQWTLNSARMERPQPLLGATRATDLAINVILPWFWSRAAAGANETIRCEVERLYLAWPKAEDNAVLRLARERLLAGASDKALRTAAEQQGLLQIVRDFCDHSNAACEGCEFPELVRRLTAGV